MGNQVDIAEEVRKAVEKTLKENKLRKDEVIVILYGCKSKWSVLIYPKEPDFNVAENLVGSCLVQIKGLISKLEEEKGLKNANIFIV